MFEYFLSGGKADDDTNFLGFSFPFISDSLLDEIELLKKKWLPKYWTSENDLEEKIEEQAKRKVRTEQFNLFLR